MKTHSLLAVSLFAVTLVACVLFAQNGPPLPTGPIPPPGFTPQNVPPLTPNSRYTVSGSLAASYLDQTSSGTFQGCLVSDTGCAMNIVVCYGTVIPGTATTPPTYSKPLSCAVLAPGALVNGQSSQTYWATVSYERNGGTELPNGALTQATFNTFVIDQH